MMVAELQARYRGSWRQKIIGRQTLRSGSWRNLGNFPTHNVRRAAGDPWVPMRGRYASRSTQKASEPGPDPDLTPPSEDRSDRIKSATYDTAGKDVIRALTHGSGS